MTKDAPSPSPSGSSAMSFYRYAELLPQRVAVIDPTGKKTTYASLHRQANKVSHALRSAGLQVAERVAAALPNNVRFFELALGAAQVGIQLVPINTHLTAEEIGYLIENSGSRLVFADRQYLPQVTAALAALVGDIALIAVDAGPPHRSFEDFLAGHPERAPADRVHAHIMLYTSGTTGKPKGVVWPVSQALSPEEAVAATDRLMELRGMRHDTAAVSLVAGPLYHGAPGAWGLQGLHHAHTVLLMDKWESERFLALVVAHSVTTAQLAPIHFHRLLQLPRDVRDRYDTGSLKVVSHAGAATPVAVKQRIMDWWGPILWEYYAASEGWGTSISPTDWLAHPGSVGRADGNGAMMKILDDDGRQMPPGRPGTLWISNPTGVNSHYLGDPEKTRASRHGDFYTAGDMAYIDEDGWLYIVDRRDDLILSGGVNIYPAEVEDVLRQHPEVDDVAVVGAPDAEWGQRVHAVIVPAEISSGTEELANRLREFAAERLARFKIPREIEFRSALPYAPTGKLLRTRVRAEMVDSCAVPGSPAD